MTIRVSGKGISVGEALRDRVNDRAGEVLQKYFSGNFSGHVTIGKDKAGFRTDCMFHLDSGMTLEADSVAGDAYASVDQAMVQIEKRMRRYKSRLKDRSARKTYAATTDAATLDVASYIIEAPAGLDDDEADVEAYNPVIIAEASTSLKSLSVSEAVMELDLSGSPVVVFLHGNSGRVNLIYRRADGNIGWIDPSAAKA